MNVLPRGLEQAFLVAAGELGMCSAAWLFVRELARAEGEPAVDALRDALGRSFPVLDAVAAAWQGGTREPSVDPEPVLEACRDCAHLVVVGVETAFLDVLVPHLGQTRVALLTESPFDVDWSRVTANYPGLEAVDLSSFQRLAGRRSVLLTFIYGHDGETAQVSPAWLRVNGADVRTQFRSLVGWDVLGAPMYVYPRWMAAAPLGHFSSLAGGALQS